MAWDWYTAAEVYMTRHRQNVTLQKYRVFLFQSFRKFWRAHRYLCLRVTDAYSPSMSTPEPVDVTASNVHRKDELEAEKLGVDVEEVVVTRISEEDLIRISRECLDIHSPTGWRIALITLVMGFNMAG